MEFYCQKFANKKGEGDFDTLGHELLIAISSTFFDRMTRFLAWWLIFTCGVSFPRFFGMENSNLGSN